MFGKPLPDGPIFSIARGGGWRVAIETGRNFYGAGRSGAAEGVDRFVQRSGARGDQLAGQHRFAAGCHALAFEGAARRGFPGDRAGSTRQTAHVVFARAVAVGGADGYGHGD